MDIFPPPCVFILPNIYNKTTHDSHCIGKNREAFLSCSRAFSFWHLFYNRQILRSAGTTWLGTLSFGFLNGEKVVCCGLFFFFLSFFLHNVTFFLWACRTLNLDVVFQEGDENRCLWLLLTSIMCQISFILKVPASSSTKLNSVCSYFQENSLCEL